MTIITLGEVISSILVPPGLRSGAAGLAALVLVVSGAAAEGKPSYTTIDVPGATWTVPLAINARGSVTGYAVVGYDEPDFVRAPDGTIDTFGVKGSPLNWASCINSEGAIAGYFVLSNHWWRGLLRRSGGTIKRFNFKGARGTIANCVNDSGVMVGYYYDNGYHGFVRAADGTMTTIDPPGSIATNPTSINAKGEIAGWFVTAQGTEPGFVREPDGTFKTFIVDNQYVLVYAINEKGTVVGSYGSGGNVTGFLRKPDGTIESIDHKGFLNSSAQAINSAGAVVGFCQIGQDNHGFVLSPGGGITVFDPPGGSQTEAYGINDSGVITGEYWDNGSHGFIRTP